MIALSQFNVAICCMYCPPQTKLTGIIDTISTLRERSNGRSRFVVTGDFNIKILNYTNLSTDFLNEAACSKFTPNYYMPPTRVTNITATLIDNFMCNISLLLVRTCVVKIDVSDHYLIALLLKLI